MSSTLHGARGHGAKASLFDSTSSFCEKCRNIQWQKPHPISNPDIPPDGPDEWACDHYESVAQLEQSARQGCPLCHICSLHMSAGDAIIGNPYDWRLIFTVKQPTVVFVLCFSIISFTNGEEMWRSVGWIPIGNTTFSCVPQEWLGATHRPENLNSDLGKLVRGTIQPWMNTCLAGEGSHSRCRPDGTVPFSLPTRLIDVGRPNADIVRLVDTAGQVNGRGRHDYLILSYVWGKGNKPARTTLANLKHRQSGIMMKALPASIKDAIILTRAMGIRYLWVDAICIIQPDGQKGDDKDWQAEAPKMGAYYSNALCCIYASLAADSSDGFLAERFSWRFPLRPLYFAKPKSAPYQNPEGPPEFFKIDIPNGSDSINYDKMQTMQRAWCLQEWLLPQRKLHWTKYGLFWECCGVYGVSENNPLDLPLDVPDFWRPIFSRPEGESFPESWFVVVTRYSTMKLTHETDRLAAIQGIANRLCDTYGDEYFGGIFRSYVVQGLTWSRTRNGFNFRPNDLFPSWSWASMPTAQYKAFNPFHEPIAKCFHFGPHITSTGINDFDKSHNRSIGMEAPLIHLEVTADASHLEYYGKGYYGNGPYAIIQFASTTWPGAMIWLIPDTPCMPMARLDIMMLTRYVSTPDRKEGGIELGKIEYYGILVAKLAEDPNEQLDGILCRRVGHIQLIVKIEDDPPQFDLRPSVLQENGSEDATKLIAKIGDRFAKYKDLRQTRALEVVPLGGYIRG
ncbi:hypothetical protein FALBO_2108 [Fusarium albosuccineum]|uniref:Heterokaryon incompatibility domain-containing protein n=1 Tax=Fusarium albosuccineum TaxID=1237068 RepID=A0A8H4LJZ0_9HYPO|nr:hypothetical protein FALBO_2108 [Fusarium albosuccineum]